MEYEENQFVDDYNSRQRASAAIGIGTIVKGYESLQRIIRNTTLTEKEKFLEAVQLFCYKEGFMYQVVNYETISERFPRIRFLNPPACVLALSKCLVGNNDVNMDSFRNPQLLEKAAEYEIEPLDLYRYAVIISNILKGQ